MQKIAATLCCHRRLSGGVGLEPLTFKSDVYLANLDATVSPLFNVHEILVLESGK